ncbi:segregation and condensation protein A [Corynebacterium heidelbergense]|uniref:Segregation and condensation protein A n=1 Tax=Corynebacterium heidelbergense TaxID=2055947 RepID=A0A364VCJ0_9CORY|nr:segregation/condensation protein A [Corynebacterium heidelbergense]RAV34357.1 segregation/condensation protein A [Corynebacterium heidelbergense]WCZ36473.1 Segregation and condensation protein A [Corynebacterium heidelbergense]
MTAAEQPEITGFRVALANFDGPFDLLLQLISSRKLDITEVALAEVTDEFIAYTRSLSVSVKHRTGPDQARALDEITEFLVVAATLVDLKAARLIPRGEVEDEEDLALLESRDLLFARLLQYRAYKSVANVFAQWRREAARRFPPGLSLEPQHANLLPPVQLGHTPQSFAELAASVFRPRPTEVDTGHVHRPAVSVPEQAGHILNTLKVAGENRWVSFASLISDTGVSMIIVGRFLALLELYKARAIGIEQSEPLEDMSIAWTGLDVDPAVVASANWN